ncbi:MAG: SLATT domain-containing protein [Halodesulfurarchaeum sp.]|nr:SLATT domain-containing protein [Halodesulfurarchaeum sp.]
MNEDNFDYEAHERLRTRVANKMDGLLWTYKQHYKAGGAYAGINQAADITSTVLAGILTYALIWEAFSTQVMAVLAVGIAVISGFRTAARPQKRLENHYRAGAAYQRLFDEFRDFATLDLADKEYGLENMREDFEELATERRELNENQDDLSSTWYYWLKLSYRIRGGSPYQEIETSETAKRKLAGETNLTGKRPGQDTVDEETKNRLTGSLNGRGE